MPDDMDTGSTGNRFMCFHAAAAEDRFGRHSRPPPAARNLHATAPRLAGRPTAGIISDDTEQLDRVNDDCDSASAIAEAPDEETTVLDETVSAVLTQSSVDDAALSLLTASASPMAATASLAMPDEFDAPDADPSFVCLVQDGIYCVCCDVTRREKLDTWLHDGPAFVRVSIRRAYSCSNHVRSARGCRHVALVKRILEATNVGRVVSAVDARAPPLSFKRRPAHLPDDYALLHPILAKGLAPIVTKSGLSSSISFITTCVPTVSCVCSDFASLGAPVGQCSCKLQCTCVGGKWGEPRLLNRDATLHTCNGPMAALLYVRDCQSCGAVLHYDGYEDGNFTLDSSNIFDMKLVYLLARGFYNSGATYFGSSRQFSLLYQLSERAISTDRAIIRRMFQSFLMLCNSPGNHFCCPECNGKAKVLVMDLKARAPLLRNFPEIVDRRPVAAVQMKGLDYTDMVFFSGPKSRRPKALIQRWVDVGQRTKRLSHEELTEMVAALKPTGKQDSRFCTLYPVLVHITVPSAASAVDSSMLVCPSAWRHLLHGLVGDAICPSVASDSAAMYEQLSNGQAATGDLGCALQQCNPSFLTFLTEIGSTTFPTCTQLLLKAMAAMSKRAHEGTYQYVKPLNSEQKRQQELTREYEQVSYEALKLRGIYLADEYRWQRKCRALYQASTTGRTGKAMTDMGSSLLWCNKKFDKSAFHGGGLLTVECSHGYNIGFAYIRQHENLAAYMELLLDAFGGPRKPDAIVFDYGCGLHRYTLARDPVFFRGIQICIDRLHFKNHTSCSNLYNTQLYEHRPLFKGLNTQAAEHLNGVASRITTSITYMKLGNAVAFMAHFLYHYNATKLASKTKVQKGRSQRRRVGDKHPRSALSDNFGLTTDELTAALAPSLYDTQGVRMEAPHEDMSAYDSFDSFGDMPDEEDAFDADAELLLASLG
jgi:hypothetical protein